MSTWSILSVWVALFSLLNCLWKSLVLRIFVNYIKKGVIILDSRFISAMQKSVASLRMKSQSRLTSLAGLDLNQAGLYRSTQVLSIAPGNFWKSVQDLWHTYNVLLVFQIIHGPLIS